MRAWQLTGGLGTDHLCLTDVPDPEPAAGEVRLRMTAASLNYRDLLMIKHGVGAGPSPTLTPLSDGVGVVDAIGPGVTRFAVGERLATMFYQDWLAGPPSGAHQAKLGWPVLGVARDMAVYSQEGLSRVPDYLSDAEAATLPCAGLTAWRALFVDEILFPGDTVLCLGTGGVSIFALQFAKAAGFRVIITSSSDSKLTRARELGADIQINYREHPDWAESVRAATGGRGADFVLEVGGARTIDQSLKAVRTGGHIAMVGALSAEREPVDLIRIVLASVRLQGLSVGSRATFEAMCRTLEYDRMRPVVDRVFGFPRLKEAFEAMQSGVHFGKIVVTW